MIGDELIRHANESQGSPRKHSVLVKRASGTLEGIKRTSSGLDGHGVKFGDLQGTGTIVARDRISQHQATNAEYASDGQMRSTMYITNAMGGQNYLGYPQGAEPVSTVINLGKPTETNFLTVDALGNDTHGVLKNQVIGGGIIQTSP